MLFPVTILVLILNSSSAINSKSFIISTLKEYSEETVLRVTSHQSVLKCSMKCSEDAGCKEFAIIQDENDQNACMLFKDSQLGKPRNGPKTVIKYYEQSVKTQIDVKLGQPLWQGLDYNVPPSPSEEWFSECTGHSRDFIAVGFDSGGFVYGRGIVEQLDFIICGGMHADLLTDDASGEAIVISNTKQECSQGKVITAIYDLVASWQSIEGFKCKSLLNNWKVDYNDCETIEATTTVQEVLHCQVGSGFYAMIAIWQRRGDNGITFIKCCTLTK